MARRKGKSRNRIKDWQQRYLAEDGFEHDGEPRKSFTRREFKIPQRVLATGAEDVGDLPRAEGMVLGQFPGGATVRVDGRALLCRIAGTFRAPPESTALALGDIVTVALAGAEHGPGHDAADKDRADAVVLQRQPRRTALCRPQPRGGKRLDAHEAGAFEKVIAANMDVLVIVAAARKPATPAGLIDRFLIIAERGEMSPVLVVNKIDLAGADQPGLDHFRALGLDILPCSAVTGDGLDRLVVALAGKRSVLAGPSGVGKSTLINAIIPGASAATRRVRAKDDRGRHTTSSSVVYDLPGGGMIVDTPGLRELGMSIKPEELPWYFPEFEAPAGQCKFRNCTHTHEPLCAVLAAVEAGTIPRRRYRSYLNILETLPATRRRPL